MKKSTLFLTFLVLGALVILPSVLAAGPSWTEVGTQVAKYASTVPQLLFGEQQFGQNEPLLFSRFLLFVLVLGVVYWVLAKWMFSMGSGLRMILSAIVAILGVRILPSNFIALILLPYGTLFVTISAFAPLIILVFFIGSVPPKIGGMEIGGVIRKAMWIFAGICFIFLAFLRANALQGLEWVYYLTAMLTLGFVLIDNTTVSLREYYEKLADQTADGRRIIRKVDDDISSITSHMSRASSQRERDLLQDDLNDDLIRKEEITKQIAKIDNSLKRQYKVYTRWAGMALVMAGVVILFVVLSKIFA